jgi:peptide/nickel transport system permease protein
VSSRQVTWFIARRLAAMVALLVFISFLVFSLLYLAPGDAEQVLLGQKPQSPEAIAAVREQYHLDKSFLEQYWIWLRGALHGDLGASIRTDEPVTTVIRDRIGVDLFLGVYAFAIAICVGVPLGILAALRRRTFGDRAIVGVSVMGVSAPPFASGLLLLYLFTVFLNWFPAFGAGDGFFSRLNHLTLPAIALALTATALVVKLTRAGMITALEQDYVVFARARGLPERRVLYSYAFRNALVPIVTSAGLILGYLLTGGILVEVAFSLGGAGSTMVSAVSNKDLPVVQGIALVIATIVILANLLIDIVYLAIDPRMRMRAAS